MLGQEICSSSRLRIGRADGILLSVFTAFSLFSFGYSLKLKNALYALSSIGCLLLVFAPYVLEAVFRIRISMDLKITYAFLSVSGPVLGNVYKFYHIIPHWDKLLHGLSGYAFAAFGFSLPDLIERRKEGHSKLMRAAFAFCFSLAVAGIWELYEYALDVFFKMDMQNDTIISNISSYLLGAQTGDIGEIGDITSVYVNGHPLPYTGYLDIGLIDTMNDMLICTVGTLFLIIAAVTRKEHSNFATIAVLQ